MRDAHGHVDPFVDEIDRTIEQMQTHGHGRILSDELVEDGPQEILTCGDGRREREHAARRGALACNEQVGFFEIGQDATARYGVAFAGFAELDRARRAMQ